jgi:hypothetical protein
MDYCRHLFWCILEFLILHLQTLALMLKIISLLPYHLNLLSHVSLILIRLLYHSLKLFLKVSDPTLKGPDLLTLSLALTPDLTHVELILGLE